MKQIIMMALSICVVCAAHAVAVPWQELAKGSIASGATSWSAKTENKYSGNGDFAARVTYVGKVKDSIAQHWASLLAIDNAGNTTDVEENEEGKLWVTGNHVSANQYLRPGAEVNFSVMLVYDDSANTMTCVATDHLTGRSETVATITQDINAWVTLSGGGGTANNRPLNRIFAEGAAYTVEYTTDISQLPEPTALAFLALGVAGMALRRRVV